MTPAQRRCDAIHEIGCIACHKLDKPYTPCQVHHINLDDKAGQKRLGELFTVGLCPWHHEAIRPDCYTEEWMLGEFGPSRKLHSRAFKAKFGNGDALLVYQDERIAELKARAA